MAKETDTWTEELRQVAVPGGIPTEVAAPGADPQKPRPSALTCPGLGECTRPQTDLRICQPPVSSKQPCPPSLPLRVCPGDSPAVPQGPSERQAGLRLSHSWPEAWEIPAPSVSSPWAPAAWSLCLTPGQDPKYSLNPKVHTFHHVQSQDSAGAFQSSQGMFSCKQSFH